MPLLSFYLNPGMLSAPEKAELAQFLTAGYAKVMPAFYVNIVFHEVIYPKLLL
jgi:phenylpyruvate tautomerase PptA (4-oxalocrotonate tautomerase family)